MVYFISEGKNKIRVEAIMVLSIIWSKKVNEVGHSRIEAIMILNMIWYKNVKSLEKKSK